MKHLLKISMLTLALLFLWPAPQAKAIDPVTIAILAPIAIKAAQVAAPYVMKGMVGAGKCIWKMCKDVFEMLYFPVGMGQVMFLFPWGGVRPGVKKMLKGMIAPGKLLLHTLLFPVMMCGVDINI